MNNLVNVDTVTSSPVFSGANLAPKKTVRFTTSLYGSSMKVLEAQVTNSIKITLPSRNVLRSSLTIYDIGWSVEKSLNMRAKFSAILEDWDDPKMDVYNDL